MRLRAVTLALLVPLACAVPRPCTLPTLYCNQSAAPDARARDLAARLNVTQLVTQLSTFSFVTSQFSGITPGIDALALPQWNYHSEALHGVRQSPDHIRTTLFPQVTAMAATANLTLVRAMAAVIGREARAINNRENGTQFTKGGGLSYWGPTINVYRDPRWGRGQESVSEDPWLNGAYAAAWVAGAQRGDHRGGDATDALGGGGGERAYLQVAACCKHLAGYSVETARKHFDARIDAHDLSETFLPAFRRCVEEGRPQQVMCAYNAINGVPSCAAGWLLDGTLRGAWGFRGSVVSDCDCVAGVHGGHNYTPTDAGAVAATINAGCDQDCGSWTHDFGEAAVRDGLVAEGALRGALARVLEMRFRLGEFDDAAKNPHARVTATCAPADKALALQAARESVVLLNNSAGLLPLPLALDGGGGARPRIAVVGPLANASDVMMGGKSDFQPCDGPPVSVLAGLASHGADVVGYAPGCADGAACENASGFAAAAALAAASDVVVAVVGIDGSVEYEGHDRDNITLPGAQEALLEQLAAAAPRGAAQIVVVLLNGGSVSSEFAARRAGAALDGLEGGMYGGAAVADALFGAVNPSGVLPFTVYPPSFAAARNFTDFRMRPAAAAVAAADEAAARGAPPPGPGLTYRYYSHAEPPLWCFGHGLSYTRFELAWVDGAPRPTRDAPLRLRTDDARVAATSAADGLALRVRVANAGPVAGARVVQLYVAPSGVGGVADVDLPRRRLIALGKVHVAPGEAAELALSTADGAPAFMSFATYNGTNGTRAIRPGSYVLSVGDGCVSDIEYAVELDGPVVPV